MRRVTAGLGLLAVMFMFLLVLGPLTVHASASVVQQTSVEVVSSNSHGLAFASSVTSGNVVVVGIATTGSITVSSVMDSRGSSYAQADELPVDISYDSGGFIFIATVAIYYAALSSSGADTVTVTLSASSVDWQMYIFEVSGVTASGVTHGDGFLPSWPAGSPPSLPLTTATSSTSFMPPGFVLGVVATFDGPTPFGSDTINAGSGFTAVAPPTNNGGDDLSFVEYSTSVSSPTTFPATISSTSSQSWVEVGAAFPALPAPPIPEYPFGLAVLAIFMVLAYGVIRRKTITKQK